MFGSSTQFKEWTFKDDMELSVLREDANMDYIKKYGEEQNIPVEKRGEHYLSSEQELKLVKIYENFLRDFCLKFRDPRDSRIRMPINVIATSQHYFKRFYLYNSVMDFHPKEILVTCVYLACKIEEFYVTINDFIYNVKGDKQKAAEIILNNELQLTQELQFHLIVHQPYRPVEGLLIDIKTRYPQMNDPERLRPFIDEFLEKVHLSDAILLYSPSQIALAAVTTGASKLRETLDKYVTDILFKDNPDSIQVLIEAVRKIRKIVKNLPPTCPDNEKKSIEARLEVCRNEYNNPNSDKYRGNDNDWDDDLPPAADYNSSAPIGMSSTYDTIAGVLRLEDCG